MNSAERHQGGEPLVLAESAGTPPTWLIVSFLAAVLVVVVWIAVVIRDGRRDKHRERLSRRIADRGGWRPLILIGLRYEKGWSAEQIGVLRLKIDPRHALFPGPTQQVRSQLEYLTGWHPIEVSQHGDEVQVRQV